MKKVLAASAVSVALVVPAVAQAGDAISTRWAGWVDVAEPGYQFADVAAKFNVPRNARCHDGSDEAVFWVGIGGGLVKPNNANANNDVEQTGIWLKCTRELIPYFVPFRETFPETPIFPSAGYVRAGDVITAVVAMRSENQYLVTLRDVTQHQELWRSGLSCPLGTHQRITVTSCPNKTAEVITEDPDSSSAPGSTHPLADFGSITYSNTVVWTISAPGFQSLPDWRPGPLRGDHPYYTGNPFQMLNSSAHVVPSPLSTGGYSPLPTPIYGSFSTSYAR